MLTVQAMLEAKDAGCLPCAASGGSAAPGMGKGSCGWVATAGNGNVARLMECKRQAAGLPVASRRAESHGAWSLLLAIARLLEHRKLRKKYKKGRFTEAS